MEAVRCRYHHNNDHAGVLNICMLVAMLETILFVTLDILGGWRKILKCLGCGFQKSDGHVGHWEVVMRH
jgi:hypothetical protein